MNSNENALYSMTRQLNAYLGRQRNARYVADVLSVWDDESDTWADGAAFVVRTEYRDITVWWPDGKHLRMSTLPVDDLAPSDVRGFRWKQCAHLAYLIGAQIEGVTLGRGRAGEVLWVYLTDGYTLCVSPEGCALLMDAA